MKQKKNVLLYLIFFIFIFSACAQQNNTEDSKQAQMDSASEPGIETEDTQMAEENGELALGEKVIENAHLSYETTDFEGATTYTEEQIEKYEGQLESSSRGQANSSYGFVGEYISMTVRLPNDQLHSFVEQLDHYDDLYIQTQEISSNDVSKSYRDNETRISVLKEEEEALREMLKEQGSLEEILQIRTQLTEVIEEREIYESDNKDIDELADYSTVYLRIQDATRANAQNHGGFWARLKNAVVDSFYRFIAFSQQAVIALVYAFPYILIAILFIFVVWLIIRKIRKNK